MRLQEDGVWHGAFESREEAIRFAEKWCAIVQSDRFWVAESCEGAARNVEALRFAPTPPCEV